MLYQMAELLLRYPNEAERQATPEALANPFLLEAPDLDTVAQWLQFLGDDVSPDELRAIYEHQGGSPLS